MKNILFLNSERIDFDKHLDFSTFLEAGTLSKFDESTPEEILTRVKDQHVVVTKELPLPAELIDQFPPSVQLICEAGTGYNNIDLAAAARKNITVCNIPGYSTEAVAQLTMTFIMNFASSMTIQQQMIRRQNFSNFTHALQVPHFELSNKTLGIIGAGTIGQQVSKIARALNMKILTYTRTPKVYEDPAIQSATLEELLENSDFVSIHCPLTPATRHFIDLDKLKRMKPTAFLINTSRGAIIKESDLIEALNQGIIAGAGLDVQDPEPPATDNPLFTMENVLLTPHIGWKCIETRQRLLQLVKDNIDAFVKGEPINVVG